MTDFEKARSIMPLITAMGAYGVSDKERFQCSYPECEGARPDSTFYADFSVADFYGTKAIEDTYKRSFDGWKNNAKYFTELVATLNHKLWFWYDRQVESYAKLYDKLWKEADEYGCGHFKGDDASHYFKVLD